MRAHFGKMNPDKSAAELDAFVDGMIKTAASERVQFADKFSDRFMAEQVTITLLAHALCEATINAILALGLADRQTPELFALLEYGKTLEKWVTAPKTLEPTYSLLKGASLYEALKYLCKRRNAFVHYKITLHIDQKKVLDGSALERLSFGNAQRWIRRFILLPYELHAHACAQLQKLPIHTQIMFVLRHQTYVPVQGGVWPPATEMLAKA
jgi:hypothetical protein